ncbi:hypothetical protein S7711_11471 [Stachybotrys chartarum IBT 7711]|uniref:Uncharacterized protein n=1 Tax=Stachybotrys chartarum (strain CBS 109288 / IBT 7711) TaxID=1280523 RepID=A0A084B1F0_STACB|nr:hypothetical protein S7711_11471 [Stachybotrys chartarum IBT 7711]
MASPAAEDAVKTGHGASPAREENDAPEDTESRTYKPSRSAEKYEGVTHEEYSSQIRKLVPDIAGNLNEIRAILIAAAQNLGIEVPRKATSDINIELLKPNNDAYNKEEWIAAEGAEPDPTWKGQRFGKEWFIACHRAQLNPQQAAVILAQLGGKFRETKPASSFLDKFIHGWSTDCITASAGVTSLSRDRLHSVMEWKAANIRPWVRGNGVAAFAFRIHSWCGPWASEWGRLLDGIDNVSSVDLADILSHPKRLKIMFDDPGSEFALSEFYFAVLQLLRIAHDWIQESMDDLNTLVRTLEVDYMANVSKSSLLPGSSDLDQAATEVFRQNWEAVVSHQQRLAKELLNRIAKKQGEVSSLRDGLFNATSVSEATKSTQLNHYILVFTVVTIFYLPLSFVAEASVNYLEVESKPLSVGSAPAYLVARDGGTCPAR